MYLCFYSRFSCKYIHVHIHVHVLKTLCIDVHVFYCINFLLRFRHIIVLQLYLIFGDELCAPYLLFLFSYSTCILYVNRRVYILFMQVYLSLGNRVSLTLVLTEQAIYLGKENFAQWPLPKVQELPKRDDLKPPFSNVKRKDINDVEQIVRFFYFTCFCMLIIASHMYKPGSYLLFCAAQTCKRC